MAHAVASVIVIFAFVVEFVVVIVFGIVVVFVIVGDAADFFVDALDSVVFVDYTT